MCVTLEEAIEIVRAEKKSGKVLSVGFQPRFDENMKMIKKIVQSGELGQIYYIQTGGGRRRGIPFPFGTTFIEKETGGIGALGDIGCYSLDCVLNAIGYPKPLTVSGYTSAFFGTDPNYSAYVAAGHPEYAEKFGVDDFAAGFVRLEGGIVLDFRIAWAMQLDTPGDTIIMGTKGSLRVPSTECWNGTFTSPLKIYHDVAGNQVCTEIPLIQEMPGEPSLFDKKIRTFLDACKNGTPAPVPTSQIIYNQAILDGIAKSAAAGREIEINIPEI
jgi:predicted dehydrogenase